MRVSLHAVMQLVAVTFALARGVGEFASLQRWRMKERLGR